MPIAGKGTLSVFRNAAASALWPWQHGIFHAKSLQLGLMPANLGSASLKLHDSQ